MVSVKLKYLNGEDRWKQDIQSIWKKSKGIFFFKPELRIYTSSSLPLVRKETRGQRCINFNETYKQYEHEVRQWALH